MDGFPVLKIGTYPRGFSDEHSFDEALAGKKIRLIAHPCTAFVSDDPCGLFSVREKIVFFAKAEDRLNEEEWNRVLTTKGVKNYKGLTAKLDEFEDGIQTLKVVQQATSKLVQNFAARHKPGNMDIVDLILRYPLAVEYAAEITKQKRIKDSKNLAERERIEHIGQQALIKHIKACTVWPDDPVSLIRIYKTIDLAKVFPSDQWRVAFGEKMLAAIKAIQNPQERIAMVEMLLLNQTTAEYSQKDLREMFREAEKIEDPIEKHRKNRELQIARQKWERADHTRNAIRDVDIKNSAVDIYGRL